MLRFYGSTDFVPFFESTLMDAMHSMDVFTSHVSRLHTNHVLSVCLLVCFLSCFTCFLTCTIMDCRLVYAYHSVLCLLFLTRQLVCRVVIPRLMTLLPFTTVCTCIYRLDIYMVGDEDSFLIFNLLCNHPTSVTCEIPHTLLVPSSSLAKATALQPEERS